jgi:putative membrane protein
MRIAVGLGQASTHSLQMKCGSLRGPHADKPHTLARRFVGEPFNYGAFVKTTAFINVSALFLGLLTLPGWADAQATQAASTTAANDLPAQDKAFVQAATMSSSTEIDASKMAAKQSSDKDVKSFAHHMMIDHTKLTAQLKMAAPHGVMVPKDNSDTAVLDSLKGLHGKAFDTAYIQKVGLEGHKSAVDAFQQEASSGSNADLKAAAQKALPTIQEHYSMAQALAKKKGVSE